MTFARRALIIFLLVVLALMAGLAVVAFSPLGGGILTGKYRKPNGEKGLDKGFAGAGFQPENSPQRTATLDTLIAVGEEVGATPSEIAIAWVAAKGSLPVIGPRTLGDIPIKGIPIFGEQ